MDTPRITGPLPAAEPVYVPHAAAPGRAPSPARRWRLFLAVFAAAAALCLLANYLRAPVFRSAATLLVEAPASQSRSAPVAVAEDGGMVLAAPTRSAQLLATEQQRLLATPLLKALAEEFAEDLSNFERAPEPLTALQSMARVQFDATTNLLDVGLEGRTPVLLQQILERWLARYEETRASATASARDSDDSSLRQQLAALDDKIAAQRAKVDGFRDEHGIVSDERAENAHAAKLKGLNESINQAADEEMRAAARLDAIRAALAAGKPVAEGKNLAAIERLQAKVELLRDTVRAQSDQYTEKFALIAPEIMAARKDLEQAERDLEAMRQRSADEVVSGAETDLATARDAKLALQAQQRELRGELTDFSRRFDALAVLRAGLAELEAQAAPLRKRLVETEVAAGDLVPRVSVLAAPSLPSVPVRPAYARDAAIGVALAFVLALGVTLLIEFLTRPAQTPVPAAPPPQIYSLNTQLFPPTSPAPALAAMPAAPALPATALPALAAARPRELAPAEISQLLHAGDTRSKLLVGLLVSGAAVEEIEVLRGGDLLDGVLHVGAPPRPLALAPTLLALWSQLGPAPDAPLFAAPDGTPLTRADLLGTLVYVAHDAGVAHPEEVTADALRHTGFAWWVRQGLKLGELPRLGGMLTPAQIASYASYAPPGAGRTLTQIGGFYPALADAARVDGTAADTV